MKQTTIKRFNKGEGLNKILIFKWVLVIFHLVGLIGLSLPILRSYFQLLTPFHLLVSTGILMIFHRSWNRNFILFAVLAFLIGFGAEVIGVRTGILFGDYQYGDVLGPKLFDVPLIIGINWFLLVYLSGEIFSKRIQNKILAAMAAATLMVLMDFLIEPVAIAMDFWNWEGNHVPLSNYLGWFVVAFLIQLIYQKLEFEKSNPLALFLFINLILFFAILNLIV